MSFYTQADLRLFNAEWTERFYHLPSNIQTIYGRTLQQFNITHFCIICHAMVKLDTLLKSFPDGTIYQLAQQKNCNN